MSYKPELLGYFVLPHDGSEGFASTSLQELIEKEYKIPFLDNGRLQSLKNLSGVERKTIDHIDLPAGLDRNIGWSPTSRFLHQMSDKLSSLIPSNKLIITTNRVIMTELIKFCNPRNSSDLTLKTKLKDQEFGKELLISHVKGRQTKQVSSTKQDSKKFGLQFELYVTNGIPDDQQNVKKDATLFSIHCLKIGEICFIYEADIDAVQYTINGINGNSTVSIFEVKTNSNRKQIEEAFKEYSKCKINELSSKKQIERSLNTLEKMSKDLKFALPLYQGELGNVHQFIYGFHGKQSQGSQSFVSAGEFNCYPGTVLNRAASNLDEHFVQLLSGTELLSPDSNLRWDDWDEWKLSKDDNYVKLEKNSKIFGKVEKWNTA